MSSFTITIEDFQGPIEALLGMIEKRKMPINDISLAAIADDYIHFVGDLDNESLSNKTHFIYVASTLTLIKSKSLLPTLELSSEEEGDIEELKKRLLILKEYQKLGLVMKSHYKSFPSFYYSKPSKKSISFQPHEGLSVEILCSSLKDVFQEIPKTMPLKKEATMRIAVHIEEMMDSLEKRIKETLNTNFDSFIASYIPKDNLEPKEKKVYQVVGFLAMLELVRKGILGVLQEHNFDTIAIEKHDHKPANN